MTMKEATRLSANKSLGRPRLPCTRLHCARSASQVVRATATSSTTSAKMKVRRAGVGDADGVSRLCADAFAKETTDEMKDAAPYLSGWLSSLQDWYSDAIAKELGLQLTKALQGKLVATRESQTLQLRYLTNLRRLEKQSVDYRSTQGARTLKRLISSKDMQRMFCCILAENEEKEVVASVTVSMTVPDALLPPPFPTRGIERFYIGNMVVREDYRRKGLATELLMECERLARRWNCDSLWLHVGVQASGAQRLYKNLGYKERGEDPWWKIVEKRFLYCKELPLPPNSKFARINRE